MAFFLSAGMLGKLCRELIEGGYEPDTPAALVYKASWPEQKILRAALSDLSARAKEAGMPRKTALVLVGKFLGDGSLGGAYEVSRLYDASFEHEFRGACSIEACSIEANSHEACSLEACSHETSLPKIKAVVAAFTRAGALLGLRIAGALGGRVFAPERYAGGGVESLTGTVFDWAGEWFSKSDALIFVSAAGIAVRAVASHVKDKTTDPAVVALDDAGENVISLLSGHVGGGNELARKIAAVTGGRAIVTTATDTHGIQSADEWAARNDCAIENAAAVKQISAATLDMASIGIAVTDESVAPPWPVTLWLRPRVLVLGVGCGRGVAKADLDAAAEDFLRGAGRSPLALKAVASIDLKRDEPAILDFCRERGIPFVTYGTEELRSVRGSFSSSQRVLEATGVDNVCERAAVLAAGSGILLRSKTRYPRISLALARLVGKIP
jgi:cobalt-precorrin 5A hydrolase